MKKLVLFLFIISMSLTLIGCGEAPATEDTTPKQVVETQQPSGEIIDDTNMNPEDTISDENDNSTNIEDKKILEEAVANSLDVNKCNSIQDELLRNYCIKDVITSLAIQNQDLSKCKEIKVKEDMDYCTEKVEAEIEANKEIPIDRSEEY